MRFLHTSDWHLGVSLNFVDCQPEQELFLQWLVTTLRERAVEVLVIAGDIFHYSNPSNAAQKLYYEFLRDCTEIATLRAIVVVAGNHDSASGLEAPRQLLQLFNMHVVGALSSDPHSWAEQCLVPVTGVSGAVELVIAAVPYVQEARLGVSLREGGESQLREQYTRAFAQLYSRLADAAQQRWPGAQLIATGHLTVYHNAAKEAKKGDYHSPIHRTRRPRAGEGDAEYSDVIGTIEAMGPDIFDPRFRYIALGHIHRPMPVTGARHIRYCGTPIATSVDDREPARQVLLVDIDGEDPAAEVGIETIKVPVWREVFKLEGSRAELSEALRNLHTDGSLAPALFLTVILGPDEVSGVSHLEHFQAILQKSHSPGRAPVVAELTQRRDVLADGGAPAPSLGPVEELTMPEVFEALYRHKNPDKSSPSAGLLAKFSEIHQQFLDSDASSRGES